jgi:antitoxin HicB
MILTPDSNGTIRVECPDVPELHTFGKDREDALRKASDALETALSFYVEEGQDLPVPSRARSRKTPLVGVSALVEMKLAIHQAMLDGHVSKSELARRLNCHLPQVDRLLDLGHASRLDRIEAALRVLGKRLSVEIQAA